MKRRTFLKTSAYSLASAAFLPGNSFAAPTTASGGGIYKLENDFMIWQVEASLDKVTTTKFINKLAGGSSDLSHNSELYIKIASHEERIDIPWWYTHTGPDDDTSSPDDEQGYRQHFFMPEGVEDNTWNATLNLLQHGFLGVAAPPIFNGYVWFRQHFFLPKVPSQKPVSLCLGGYDQQDWKQYWVWVNGNAVAQWKNEIVKGRWQDPHTITLHPGTPEYNALNFGQQNLIAVRTFGADKSCADIRPEALDRYAFDGRLCDQYLTVGTPFKEVSSFRVVRSGMAIADNKSTLLCELQVDDELMIKLYYQLDGFSRRKWIDITNISTKTMTVLDIELDRLSLGNTRTEGDFGDPVILEDGFCAVEHPAGLSQISGNGDIRLRHFPGKTLLPNESMTSKTAIVAVSKTGVGKEQFRTSIEQRSPRKGLRSIYDPLGIRGLDDDTCWVLNDDEMIENVKHMRFLRNAGVTFDYYVPDVGWQDQTGDMTQYWPQCFPNGAKPVVDQVHDAGMKWGLWFAATMADWGAGQNPVNVPSRTAIPGGVWPPYAYRNGFESRNDLRQFCIASEPYRSQLKNAILWHIHEEKLDFFKLDCGIYYCNNPAHEHMPGKYSVEAAYDATIEIAQAVRAISPEIYIMWYWGIRSPFFALFGDSIFESRLHMEGASTSDYPALFFRDAVTLALDQATSLADLIPPRNKDSLGIWLTDTSWGNSMRKERWREALVMDLGRGNLLFPQIWGDLNLLSEDDVVFLARIQAFAKEHEQLLCQKRISFGDPWKAEVYGYIYSSGSESLIFINNVDFQARNFSLEFNEDIGLVTNKNRIHVETIFPEIAPLRINNNDLFAFGDRAEVWLRPFEVAIWRISSQPKTEKIAKIARRLESSKSEVQSIKIDFRHIDNLPELEAPLAEPTAGSRSTATSPTLEDFKKLGYDKRFVCFESRLPEINLDRHMIAIILRFTKNGKPWRCNQPSDLIQALAFVAEKKLIEFETVPNSRQTNNNELTPWLVFRMRSNATWSEKMITIGLTAYLPSNVNIQIDGYIVPEWWGAELSV
jgi:hypothetical protein